MTGEPQTTGETAVHLTGLSKSNSTVVDSATGMVALLRQRLTRFSISC